jgi:hypothetical protein
MLLKIFLPKKMAKNGFFAQTAASFCKILTITLIFEKSQYFRLKLAKIAENCDHNIDPRFQENVSRVATSLQSHLHRNISHPKLQKYKHEANDPILMRTREPIQRLPHLQPQHWRRSGKILFYKRRKKL